MHIFNRILGQDKYTSPSMPCPACGANRAKCLGSIGLAVTRWKCSACNQTWRYLKATAPPDPTDTAKNPLLALGSTQIIEKHFMPSLNGMRRKIPIVGRPKIVRKIMVGQS